MASAVPRIASIHRAGLRPAGAQPVRRRRLPAAADPRRALAEPVPVGPAGSAALCRPVQLAIGADRLRLRQLADRHGALRGDRGAGADGAGAAGRVDAGPPASRHRAVSHRCTCCRGSARRWRSRCCGAGSWPPPTAPSAPLLGHSIEWLSDPSLALPLVSAVVVWTNVGYVSLSFLAGLLAIPDDIHAAARTDGANAWQRFWRITLPMLRPTMFFVLVTGIVSTAQVFDTVYALTGGGPARQHRPGGPPHLRRGLRRRRRSAGRRSWRWCCSSS